MKVKRAILCGMVKFMVMVIGEGGSRLTKRLVEGSGH